MSKFKSLVVAFVSSTFVYAVAAALTPPKNIDASVITGCLILGAMVVGLSVTITHLAGRTAHQIGFFTTVTALSSVAVLAFFLAFREPLLGLQGPIPVMTIVNALTGMACYGTAAGYVGAVATKYSVRS